MSKTFYGYVKRDLTKDPDWAAVTSKITDDLVDISKERQATRDDIQKKTLATQDILNTYDQGANQTFNSAIQNGSGQAVDYTLQQYKMLKNGDINYRDYLSSIQVQQDDWKNLNKVSKGWNEKYDEYLRRVKDGESSILEQDSAKYIESFGNISDKTFITNKSNGRLYMATVNPDGSINQDPNTMTTVAAVGNILNDKIDKVDVIGEVNRQVQTLGKVITSMGGKDGIATIEDIREQADYKKAEKAIVEGILTTDRDKASVLLDYLKEYKTTRDPSKADETTILLVKDDNGLFQPKLTDTQEKSAYAAVKDQLRSQLDYIETAAAPKAKGSSNPYWAKRNDAERLVANKYKPAMDIALGGEDFEDAVTAVTTDVNSGVRNILTRGKDIVIQFTDNRGDQIIPKGEDVTETSKLLYKYINPSVTDAGGASEAYSIWAKFYSPGAEGTGGGSYMDIEAMPVSQVVLDDGSKLTEKLSGIFNAATRAEQKFIDITNVLTRVELPGGRNLKDLTISVDGVISVPSLPVRDTAGNIKTIINAGGVIEGETYKSDPIPIGARSPIVLNNILQDIVDKIIIEENTAAEAAGVMAGF